MLYWNTLKVQGTCSKGYEIVQALFEDNFRSKQEINAQLCIYVDGEKVVDLYGTAIGDTKYGPDTLTVSIENIHNNYTPFTIQQYSCSFMINLYWVFSIYPVS